METARKYKAQIERKKKELIGLIQKYSRSQVKLWRQVPGLARKADKLQQHTSGRYQLAYRCHVWPVFASDIHGLQVNLITGELGPDGIIQLNERLGRLTLDQLSIAFGLLNAQEVIYNLQERILNLSASQS